MKLFKKLAATALVLVSGFGFATSAAAELMTNGDFEAKEAGWVNENLVHTAVYGHVPYGTYALYFGCVGRLCSTYQTIATTAGASYIFSFDYGSNGSMPSEFLASFDGVNVFHTMNGGSTSPGFLHKSFTVLATGASTLVKFRGRNDPNFIALDNVSVVQSSGTVPEPGSIALLLAGLGGLGFINRRKV